MAVDFIDLVGETGTFVSATPRVDLSGTAPDDHQTFTAAGVTTTNTVYVVIKTNATNLLVWEATWTDAAPDTLTRVTELEAIGTVANSDSVTCYLVNPALIVDRSYLGTRGFIEGLPLAYATTTTLTLGEGRCVVNGSMLEVGSGGTTTSTGDAITAATNSQGDLLYVYIWDDAGTVKMHWEIGQTSSEPVWDTVLDYGKHPVDGASKRFIGAVFIGNNGVTDDVFTPFNYSSIGRLRRYEPHIFMARVVSAGSATTATSTDCTKYLPAVSVGITAGFKIHCKMAGTPGTDVVITSWAQTALQCDGNFGLQVSAEMDNTSKAAALGPLVMGYDSTTFYYKVDDANTDGFVDVNWFEVRV